MHGESHSTEILSHAHLHPFLFLRFLARLWQFCIVPFDGMQKAIPAD
jgi:hypothetical protein